jgi:hypothetical protein
MPDTLDTLAKLRVVPIIVIDDASSAEPLAVAMRGGGVQCAEISMKTPAATAALKVLAAMPDMLVGAGSVTSEDELKSAVDSGAQFIVTPGLDERLVETAQNSECAHHPWCHDSLRGAAGAAARPAQPAFLSLHGGGWIGGARCLLWSLPRHEVFACRRPQYREPSRLPSSP